MIALSPQKASLGAALCLLFPLPGFAEPISAELPTPTYGNPGDYPIAMSFRRASMETLDQISYQRQIVIGTATRYYRGQEKVAHTFKQRQPDARVLVQYYWDAFPRAVPLQVASAKNYRYLGDPEYYPFPTFNGFYLCQHPAVVETDFPLENETASIQLSLEGGWRGLSQAAQRHGNALKGLLYALDKNDAPDFSRSEFVRITGIDFSNHTATIERLAPVDGSEWNSYQKNRARIGLPAFVTPGGSLFYPNLSDYCPRDPETGMNAREYWARHISNYFRNRLSGLNGLAFDVPPFAPHHGADIDNDGEIDHGYQDGVNYMGLGLYDFFDALRNGSEFDPGLGDEILISVDGQEMADQRFPDITNGAENEDFPGFMDFTRFSEQFHSHLWWCDRARKPNTSYPVMRFPTEAYHNAKDSDRLYPWMTNGHARLGIAMACFGNGVVAYEATRMWENKKPIANLASGSKGSPPPFVLNRPHYLWDEYNAGLRNQFGWLGKPTGSMKRLTDHLGNELLSDNAFGKFVSIPKDDPAIHVSGLDLEIENRALEIDVAFLGTPLHPWTSMAGPKGPERLVRSTSSVLRSGFFDKAVESGTEVCVRLSGMAEPDYGQVDARYHRIPIPMGLRLRVGEAKVSQSTWVYLDRTLSEIQVTLVAPASGKPQLEFLVGTEPGRVILKDISLTTGCAEVAWRSFENGLVLLNASNTNAATFPLAEMEPHRTFRRIQGVIDPDWNDGSRAGSSVTLPPNEALFLEALPN